MTELLTRIISGSSALRAPLYSEGYIKYFFRVLCSGQRYLPERSTDCYLAFPLKRPEYSALWVIVVAHPTTKNIILHIRAKDVVNNSLKCWKWYFIFLLNTVSSLNAEVLISGPLPPIRKGVERFSRLLSLNTWLSTACTVHSLHFIDNF